MILFTLQLNTTPTIPRSCLFSKLLPKLKNSMQFKFKYFVRLIITTIITATMLLHTLAHSSTGTMSIPTACEMEWESLKFVQPLPPQQITRQKDLAERGDADAQYFMGLASQDKNEQLVWLKKAIANGSKGAAAYYAYVLDERWKTEPVDPANPNSPRKPVSLELLAELLKPVIDAAEAGEPQAATWLMEMGRSRWEYKINGPHPILKLSDIPKWAEIAARGGNPAAAELLCMAHDRSHINLEGLEKNDAEAFYWCSIVAPRTCADNAKIILEKLYRRGIGTTPSKALADYWNSRSKKSSKGILIEHLDRSPLPIVTR